jgi:hypothetical protein
MVSGKESLAELIFLAKKTGRVLVEPRISKIDARKKDTMLSFGTLTGDLSESQSFRSFYDIKSVVQDYGVEMITFLEYMDAITHRTDSKHDILEVQFEPPPTTYGPPLPRSCAAPEAYNPTPMYDGFPNYFQKSLPNMMDVWRVKCFRYPKRPLAADTLVTELSLASDTTSVVFTGFLIYFYNFVGYIGEFKLIDPLSFEEDLPNYDDWMFSKRLMDKAMSMIPKDGDSRQPYASVLIESFKIWAKQKPASVNCAQSIQKSLKKVLKERNIKNLVIDGDFYQNDKSPYAKISSEMKDDTSSGLNVITLDDFSDVDKAFIEEILCIEADVFLFGDEESLGPDRCTLWTSVYAYYIIGYRNGKPDVNLSDYV